MKQLLLLMDDAWAENTLTRYWCFDLNGHQKNITIKLYDLKKSKVPQTSVFFLDVYGLPTAIKYIFDNLRS